MGPVDSLPLDETVGDSSQRCAVGSTGAGRRRCFDELIVLLFAAVIFLGCIVSPPSLLDDVDAVQAQISRTMLQSGDWVTARLDGIAYLEKSPLKYWMIAISFDQSFELIGEPIRCADQPVLVHDQHPEAIARIEQLGGGRIVRSAVCIYTHRL